MITRAMVSGLVSTGVHVADLRIAWPALVRHHVRLERLAGGVYVRVGHPDPESVEIGVPIGRSWILLFGLLPFDYDDVCLVRLDPGRGFLERSRMLSQRSWEHERTLEAAGGGCLITDRVSWQPRFGLSGRPLRPVIAWFFRHRHRRLRQHFGGAAVGT